MRAERGPAFTWRVIPEQEALELHSLAGEPPADRLGRHGNGQTADGAGAHARAPQKAPGTRGLEPKDLGCALQLTRPGAGRGEGVRDMLGRRARPALPPTHICLGVPEGGRRVPGAAQGVRSCPRRGHRNLHPLVSGVGGTRATRVFSKGDLTRGEARPRTKGLSYSLGHTHFNPLGFQY